MGLNACKDKCESNDLGTVKFTDEDLKIVPYKGTETLTFKDSLGNSLTYGGGGRLSEFFINHENPSDYECPGNYFYSENNTLKFIQGSYVNIQIILSMDKGSLFFKNINKYISFLIEYQEGSIHWVFYNRVFNFDALKINNSLDTTVHILHKDSLLIGPKKFLSVYQLNQKNAPSGAKNLQYVYYTIKEGIVGFKTEDKHSWYLSN